VKSVLKIFLVIGLVMAVASPALAEFKLNGYYRLQGYSVVTKSTTDSDGNSQAFINQRLRLKATYSLNDQVDVVYFGEVDTDWGESDKMGTGGGKLGTDGVNFETKNAYLHLKYPDSGCGMIAGLQGLKDAFEGVVYYDDMAALKLYSKLGDADLNLIYSKWDEGDDTVLPVPSADKRSDWDDTDIYGIELSNKFSDGFKLGAAAYFLDINAGIDVDGGGTVDYDDTEVIWLGLNGDIRSGDFALSFFGAYQDFDSKTAPTHDIGYSDVDGEAYAASVKANVIIPKGDMGLRLIYFSENDTLRDADVWAGGFGAFEFAGENLMFFLPDVYVTDHGKERYALVDAAYSGAGLLGAVFNGKVNLPSDMYAKWGVGYFRAMQGDDRTLGYEVAGQIGKKVAEKVDLSLRGAYAGFGDFYDNSVDSNGDTIGDDDPDDIYKAVAMINVAF